MAVPKFEQRVPMPALRSRSTSKRMVLAKRSRRRRRPSILGTVVLLALGVVFAFPLIWMVLSSLKSTGEYLANAYPLSWKTFLPEHVTTKNYSSLFGPLGFGRNIVNTIVASIGQIVGAVIVSTLAGYAFAKLRFPLRGLVFAACLAPAFVPTEAIVFPLYSVSRNLGLTSTYPVLFLPFIANALCIFLMRQSFAEIPDELLGAAKVDGAGPFRTFWSIALPCVRPAIATVVLVQFIWSWSSYFWPLISMQDPSKQVAQVAMAGYTAGENQPLYGEMFAAASVLTIPVVVLAILLQRYYVRGQMSSAVK
jgi:ABC-type glycerol-3-phosphate transport system permease component